MKNMLLPFLAFFPLAGAFLCYGAGRVNKKARDTLVNIVTGCELAAAAWALVLAVKGVSMDWAWDGFCAMGLHLRLDGFRAVYVCIGAVMWFFTGLFSREYFAEHYRNRNRYYFFNLLTMCGTVGMFLSESLFSAFIFFEVMSMCSYAWVAHDEKESAMRAAQTYLAVAVIGGMATLMGLFLLYHRIGTLELSGIWNACAEAEDKRGLYLIGGLIASGFAAKAGAFPAHIWLPKAHPVAPAPASALLSGILTKTGVFGLLAVGCNMFPHDALWGNAVLAFAVATMFLGALLALFSVDLKRTLACSSMSQIGFILIGVAMRSLLGEEGSLAGYGALMHMMNHSLIKLCLFMCAGAVYMRLHKLNLNDIRGFGRKKPVLHIAFLLGAWGIVGIPLGNGYISKSLLHEAILEYAHIAPVGSYFWYKATEWIFLLSGGMTAAYMTKLYICLFWEKNADGKTQERFDAMKPFGLCTKLALLVSGMLLPIMGMLPQWTLQAAAKLSMPFMHLEPHGHIAYFSGENLEGAAISLTIGAALYFGVVRALLMQRDASGKRAYVDLWPKWLDLENGLYRPMLEKTLPRAFGLLAEAGDRLFDMGLRYVLKPVAYFLTRGADEAADAGAVLLLETIFHHPRQEKREMVGSRFTYGVGMLLNGCVVALNKTVRRRQPITRDFVALFAAGREQMNDTIRRVTRSVSFGLLLLCVCMYIIFAYLLSR